MCLCETKCQGRGIATFWGAPNLPEKVSRDMGYRSDSTAISRDMGPLRNSEEYKNTTIAGEIRQKPESLTNTQGSS